MSDGTLAVLASLARREGREVDATAVARVLTCRGTRVWLDGEASYPVRDLLPDRPRVLLGEGDRSDAFDAPRVAVVGTRAATAHGIADARDIGAFLARAGVTVVSGLAIGIDAAAHEGALDAGGRVVGVVATGLDVVYPRRHRGLYERVRAQGLVVSEHWYGLQPRAWQFPIRNRIIAALADAVVVVEATIKGGALITVDHALAYGRTVFAVPGSRRNPAAMGCNALIADGALCLVAPSDILVELGRGGTASGGWSAPPARPLEPDDVVVLRALGGDPATIDEIERRVPFPPARLGAALRRLEDGGHVERRRGSWWPR